MVGHKENISILKHLRNTRSKSRMRKKVEEIHKMIFLNRYAKVRAHAMLQKKSAALSQFDSDRGQMRQFNTDRVLFCCVKVLTGSTQSQHQNCRHPRNCVAVLLPHPVSWLNLSLSYCLKPMLRYRRCYSILSNGV